MTIADYTVIILGLTCMALYLRNRMLSNRCANLETDLDRKDAILTAHLAASDEILATVAEVEAYNDSLEQQLQYERLVQLHRRVQWSVN